MHVDAQQLAVPLGQRAPVPPGVGVVHRQGSALHPRLGRQAGDGAESRGEVDEAELKLAVQLVEQAASEEFDPTAFRDEVYEKTLSNLMEVESRGGGARGVTPTGEGGAAHFDGKAWSSMTGAPKGARVVSGRDANDVWIAGAAGVWRGSKAAR